MTEPGSPTGNGFRVVRISKVFDPALGFSPLGNVIEVTDATLARREGRWWMYLAGEAAGHEGIRLFSASLPPGAALAATGWSLTIAPGDPHQVALLAPSERSAAWDLRGGRHCPAYVRGFDPARGDFVERIYYAGAPETPWGPYAIGYLEWDGVGWREAEAPVFTATEDWERGSVYEPNVLYADGRWKMWYVAGSNQEDYLVQGFSESTDGRTGWSRRQPFATAEERLFDFCPRPTARGYEAVFSRVWVAPGERPATTGLWWCRADHPSADRGDWSEPVQIVTAEQSPWGTGPWKPAWSRSDIDPRRILVFFDGLSRKDEPGGFPFAFTLGCVELERQD
jgi:hypothetical protein